VSNGQKKSDPPLSNYTFGRAPGGCHENRFLRAYEGLCDPLLVSHHCRIVGIHHHA
jgi:hypothetical protein